MNRLTMAMAALIFALASIPHGTTAAVPNPTLSPPPLPLFPPTALTGDAGNQKARLRWNPQLEDGRIVGWRVRLTVPEVKTLNDTPIVESSVDVDGLNNGMAYSFAVTGVLKDGTETPPGNTITVIPRNTGTARVTPLNGQKWPLPSHPDLVLGPDAAKVTFPDGQELVYDRLRPVDWKTRDGEHLLHPRHFGNGLDIGKFDPRGLPLVIPPDSTASDHRDLQWGTKHPWITDPMTPPLDYPKPNAVSPKWFAPEVDGDRVTFRYWQPLEAMGYRSWTYVQVWETWWPIERDRHGTKYHGLARLVEVEMPGSLKDGYQVMLNDGFGPNAGSRKGVSSYSTGFRVPAAEIVDYSGDKNRQVTWQDGKPPRQGYGYHPDQDCLQSSPLIFYDWSGQPRPGSLTITARSLYYHCANVTCTYIEQGADGVWPNLAWDLAIAGRRTAVDTVEYLYTADMSLPLPQRFVNARFEAYAEVSRRMGVQNELGAVAMETPHSQIEASGGPEKFADATVKRLNGKGVDVSAMFHDIWHSVPITVDDAYRFDENHDSNPALKAMCARLKAAGIHPGFWFRPDFTETSLPTALSDRIPTAEAYYGFDMAKYPNVVALLHQRGIPLFRQNTSWIRRRRDGAYPSQTPYDWVPMSLATEWFDRIIWPSQSMSARLGFDRALVDGGFGGLQGVDYSPMLAGKTDRAVACQPYWWRMWRCMAHVGIRTFGECTTGWKGGNVHAGGPSDQYFQWMFHLGWYVGVSGALQTPELAHRTFQLYNSNRDTPANAAVQRFARNFYEKHRAPDWIEFKNLRQTEPVDVTLTAGAAPVAGTPAAPNAPAATTSVRVRPWTWDDVIWHYDDGSQAVYPAYNKVRWAAQ